MNFVLGRKNSGIWSDKPSLRDYHLCASNDNTTKGSGSEADTLTTVALTPAMCKMIKEQKKQNNTTFCFTISSG